MGGWTTSPPDSTMPWTDIDKAEVKARKDASNAEAYERHHGFNLSAQDNHSKFERPHFAVVGEGTKAAQDAYRENYDKINWSE